MTIKPIFTIKEALKNLWRNRLMSIASIGSVMATLTILGIIFTLVININGIAQSAKDQFDTIQLYLEDGLPKETLRHMKSEMSEIAGVREVVYESKAEALARMKVQWKDNGYLLEGLEENPLPSSFIVYLKDIYYARNVLTELEGMDGVEEIKSYQDIVEQLLSITEAVRHAGSIIIFVLIAISTFIIHNTIKLTVAARRGEIMIMRYVGATAWFIRWPFLLEGTLLGLMGAGLGVLLIRLGYTYVFELLQSKYYVLFSAYIVSPDQLMSDVVFLFLVIGAGIGALGSLLSMRKYLEV